MGVHHSSAMCWSIIPGWGGGGEGAAASLLACYCLSVCLTTCLLLLATACYCLLLPATACYCLLLPDQVSDEVELDKADDDETKIKALEFFFPRGARVWVKVGAGVAGC